MEPGDLTRLRVHGKPTLPLAFCSLQRDHGQVYNDPSSLRSDLAAVAPCSCGFQRSPCLSPPRRGPARKQASGTEPQGHAPPWGCRPGGHPGRGTGSLVCRLGPRAARRLEDRCWEGLDGCVGEASGKSQS